MATSDDGICNVCIDMPCCTSCQASYVKLFSLTNPVCAWYVNPVCAWYVNPVCAWYVNPVCAWYVNPVCAWYVPSYNFIFYSHFYCFV